MALLVAKDAFVNWDRKITSLGRSWMEGVKSHPSLTLLVTTSIAFFVLKGTQKTQPILPRFVQKEALLIGTWGAQLIFSATPLLILAHHVSKKMAKIVRHVVQAAADREDEKETREGQQNPSLSPSASFGSLPGEEG